MKTTLILYGSPVQFHMGYRRVTGSQQPPYFVRVETHPGTMEQALADAKPKPGETVLNTVESEFSVARTCPSCQTARRPIAAQPQPNPQFQTGT